MLYFLVGMKIVEQVQDLVPTFRQREKFRGLGGEFMKQACSLLIEKCSLAGMPFHNHPIIGKLSAILMFLVCFSILPFALYQ